MSEDEVVESEDDPAEDRAWGLIRKHLNWRLLADGALPARDKHRIERFPADYPRTWRWIRGWIRVQMRVMVNRAPALANVPPNIIAQTVALGKEWRDSVISDPSLTQFVLSNLQDFDLAAFVE